MRSAVPLGEVKGGNHVTHAHKSAALAPRRDLCRLLYRYRFVYLMLLPAAVYYITFHYIPMFGATIAFKTFNASRGILRSDWAGLENFRRLFGLMQFQQAFWNTVRISFTRLLFGFPTPIIVSLLLHEMKNVTIKRSVQTVIYLPHFISWVIMGGLLVNLLSMEGGVVNMLVAALGGKKIAFLTDPRYFVGTMVVSMIWKEYGWSTIIYMAALSGVDPQLYEAARVDGAGRFRQVLHITLPGIASTIAVVLILRMGGIMQAGFEQIFVLYNVAVYSVADIIDTYVYRIGLMEGRFAMASAVGLFKSAINFALLAGANQLARMMGEEGVY